MWGPRRCLSCPTGAGMWGMQVPVGDMDTGIGSGCLQEVRPPWGP